ncbi:MAG TPA: beta-phosphoglucomutase family hydrolase [Lacunisphaera sp.]|nr:beta-phosphoglucomutase family hydrolase [Lacunisphaera sp.]
MTKAAQSRDTSPGKESPRPAGPTEAGAASGCDRSGAQASRPARARGENGEARAFDAAIFDLDGVVTETAAVHAEAWKRMFDEFLRHRARRRGEPFREFTQGGDYRAYVDGRPRYRGVESFLASRGLALPPGTPADEPQAETVCGLGNRKDELFREILAAGGVKVFPGTLALIGELRAAGIRVGLATSSRNSALVLAGTPAAGLFATIVDGMVLARLGLRGKPEPDIFALAAANLGVRRDRAIVIEDAVAGVQAGAAGGFALVVGVAREGNAEELRKNGADVVVGDLAEVNMEELNRLVRRLRRAG